MIRRMIAQYLREEGGVAAVEMALIAPFIAGFAVLSVNVWDVGMRKQDMRAALKLGAQYYMNGGTDDTKSKAIALAKWNRKPATADVTVSRTCLCGTTVTGSCNTVCADNTVPNIVVQLHATATTSTAMFSKSQVADEYVRVR